MQLLAGGPAPILALFWDIGKLCHPKRSVAFFNRSTRPRVTRRSLCYRSTLFLTYDANGGFTRSRWFLERYLYTILENVRTTNAFISCRTSRSFFSSATFSQTIRTSPWLMIIGFMHCDGACRRPPVRIFFHDNSRTSSVTSIRGVLEVVPQRARIAVASRTYTIWESHPRKLVSIRKPIHNHVGGTLAKNWKEIRRKILKICGKPGKVLEKFDKNCWGNVSAVSEIFWRNVEEFEEHSKSV